MADEILKILRNLTWSVREALLQHSMAAVLSKEAYVLPEGRGDNFLFWYEVHKSVMKDLPKCHTKVHG